MSGTSKIIFSKNALPNSHYVYAYYREDNTPYYVGKGSGKRAWESHKRKNNTALRPDNPSRISVIAHGLSENEAYLLEKKLTEIYGLKGEGGILVNMKLGGKGGMTISENLKEILKNIHNTEETLKRHSDASLNQWGNHDSRVKLINGIRNNEVCQKKSYATKKSWENSEIRAERIKSMLKITNTEDYKIMRANRIGLKANNVDKKIYCFVHESGIKEHCTRVELAIKYSLNKDMIGSLVHKRKKSYKGWKLND